MDEMSGKAVHKVVCFKRSFQSIDSTAMYRPDLVVTEDKDRFYANYSVNYI